MNDDIKDALIKENICIKYIMIPLLHLRSVKDLNCLQKRQIHIKEKKYFVPGDKAGAVKHKYSLLLIKLSSMMSISVIDFLLLKG